MTIIIVITIPKNIMHNGIVNFAFLKGKDKNNVVNLHQPIPSVPIALKARSAQRIPETMTYKSFLSYSSSLII